MKIAMIGAGAVALSSAALMTRKGHDVRLWSALPHEVEQLRSIAAVTCEGDIVGTFPIQVSADAAQCIAGAEIVMIAVPAFAHRSLMTSCAPHVRSDQLVVMNTATGFSSLLFSRLLAGYHVKPTIVDLATTVCMARICGPARVRLGPPKAGIDLATIPATCVKAGHAALTELFGDFFVARDFVLAVALNNHNPIYHVPAMVFGLPLVERGEDWNIWRNMTPLIACYTGKLDDERISVARHFEVDATPLASYVRASMGAVGDDLAALFAAAARKRPASTGPKTVQDRYMTEDLPYGMVFFRALGQAAGVPMPMSDHLIDFCSDVFGCDFRTGAPGLSDLGLSSPSPAEIIRAAREGF